MSGELRLSDKLRMAVPCAVARHLPARRRAKHFLARLKAGRLDQLSAVLGADDPFEGSDALFRAVDHLLNTQQSDRLTDLATLARSSSPYGAHIWRALCLWHDGHHDQAHAIFDRMAVDERYHGFARRGAETWALYLSLPRFELAAIGEPIPVMQFWDTPEPPSDVAQEMQSWQRLAGDQYTRLSLESARQFFQDTFGPKKAALFDHCPHPAVQSDLARLGWLLVNGGIYVDADARMRPGFVDLYPGLAGHTLLWFQTGSAEISILNGFVAVPAGAPFIEAAFEEACKRLSSGEEMHVFDYAGPNLWTETALKVSRRGNLTGAHTISDDAVSRFILGQMNARYKFDKRNWRAWMKTTNHASG